MYNKMLIPLDGSKTAEKVLPYARHLAGHFKMPVELIAVIDIAEMAAHMPTVKARFLDTMVEDPGWMPVQSRRLGEVTALLHNALASDPTDPHFAPEEPSSEALALLSASIDEEIEQVFTTLPVRDVLEPIAGRGEEVRDHLRALTHIGNVGRVIRTHGDSP